MLGGSGEVHQEKEVPEAQSWVTSGTEREGRSLQNSCAVNQQQLLQSTQVGGCLADHRATWHKVTNNRFVRQCIKGHLLEFNKRPHLVYKNRLHKTRPRSREEELQIQKEVTSLLSKKAIEKAPNNKGFFSRLFVVPKADGGTRPIINLKPLNKFIKKEHFRMSTLKDVKKNLQPGDWAVTLDLKDAYLHVPVHRRHRRFLRFNFKGQAYQFKTLPFGLTSAPRVFTRVTKPLLHLCRRKGIRVVFYLDDILILARTKQELLTNAKVLIKWVNRLGFHLNMKKSNLNPSQSFQYLGLNWSTVPLSVRLPLDKRQDIQ